MKCFTFLALLSAYLAYPGAVSAQCGSCKPNAVFAVPDKDMIGKMIRDQIPDKIEGRALVNATVIRPGRWRIGPIRNAIITRRRGPAPPRMGRTRTIMMKTTIYPGAGPQPQAMPRGGVQVQTPRVNVQVGGCKT